MANIKKSIYNPFLDYYKIYHDGSHYVATLIEKCTSKQNTSVPDERNNLFNELFLLAHQRSLRGFQRQGFIFTEINNSFPAYTDNEEYVNTRIQTALHNLHKRKKTFKRKAYLNIWTHFITITYSSMLHSEDTFKRKLRRCLSNLHTRRGWKYMGVFERAPDTDRLHFHALVYIPDGQMVGTITEVNDYDKKHGTIQTIHPNSFFSKRFGRNDFEELNTMDLKFGNTIQYILKYIGKTHERIVYSRGIPSEIIKNLDSANMVTSFRDYVLKYILFDGVINYERDVLNLKRYQMRFTDLSYYPLN